MLEKELEYYNAHREEFLAQHQSKFVLIKESLLAGVFSSEQDAYAEGIKRFGNQPFLIKKVGKDEEVVTLPALFLGLINASV